MAEQIGDYPEHKLMDDFQDHYKKSEPEEIDAQLPSSAPFGTHLGHEWKWDQSQNELMKEVGVRPLPIEGPPNWDTIWPNWQTIGQDYRQTYDLNQLRNADTKYANLEEIRQMQGGSFGTVYEVRNTDQNGNIQRMACKVVRLAMTGMKLRPTVDEMIADMTAIKYYKNTMASRHIVQLIDVVGISDTQTGFPYASIFILMELCSGELMTLVDGLESLDENCCWHWFSHIASALKKLHSDNIVHLDIKPENILYCYTSGAEPQNPQMDDILNMTFKLSDFGQAISFQENDSPFLTDRRRGTEDFMSQEMFDLATCDQPVEAKPCDIYSLGITLFISLMGYDYFVAHEDFSAMFAELFKEGFPEGFKSFSKKMIKIIHYMTKVNPRERPTIEEIFKLFSLVYTE